MLFMPRVKMSPELKVHWADKEKNNVAASMREIILGGQDGLVNVLGIMLGVATATADSRIAIISGIVATFAESISMAAVAYTSGKAERDYYFGERKREEREVDEVPAIEREEIRVIFAKKGFKGRDLEKIVELITKDKKRWVDTMMVEELGMLEPPKGKTFSDAFVVGGSAFAGSFIPIIPFFFLPVAPAGWTALFVSIAVLFALGVTKARLTIGKWWREGLEIALIGTASALIGFAVGYLLKVPVG